MESFKRYYLTEYATGKAAEKAGKLEVNKITLKTAAAHADAVFRERLGIGLDEMIPDFEANFKLAQRLASLGRTKRKDMPRIRVADVHNLQRRLTKGALDVAAPFAKEGDPFPDGLSGDQAKLFVTRGFRDGKLADDVVQVKGFSRAAKDLYPIQEQIYFDKVIEMLARNPGQEFVKLAAKALMISSSNSYIIDGHHRWMAAIILNPSIQMHGIMIDLPIDKLLKLTLSYTDAIGNSRNA